MNRHRNILGINIVYPLSGRASGGGGGGGGGSVDYTGKTVIFGIAGQSNAIGRAGPIDPVLDATDPNILMLNGTESGLFVAEDPLSHDFEETAGDIGFGLTFAKDFKAASGAARVILVGLAEGGAGFINGQWAPSGRALARYDKSLSRWNAGWAIASAAYGVDLVMGGLLWIQGEDEVIDSNSAFLGPDAIPEYRTMPMGLFDTMRKVWDGFDADTPIVMGSLPAGTALTGQGSYTSIQTAISTVPNYLRRVSVVDATDLGLEDDRHYNAPALRTIGQRMAVAHATALANSADPVPIPAHSLTLGPNVEVPILLDASNVTDGGLLWNQGNGGFIEFENKRVHIKGGKMQFDGDAELRWIGGASRKPRLGNRDFRLRFKATYNGTADQGFIGSYETLGNERSWTIRHRDGELQLFGSSTGSSPIAMLVCLWDGSESEFTIERIGGTITLEKDGVLQDTYALGAGYTFFNNDDDVGLLIGDYINNNNLDGTIEYLVLEFLS